MSTVVRFDCFQVDLSAGRLLKHGSRVRLRDQSFRVLELLLEHAGEVVTRDELRQRLWPGDVFVDFENSLNTAVGRLREALGDSAEQPRFIETLPRRGYRLLAGVSPLPSVPSPGGAEAGGDDETPGARPDRRRVPGLAGAHDPVAYAEFVQGRRHLDRLRSSDDAEGARGHLLSAVAQDPGFARAHEALAELCWFEGYLGLLPPRDAIAAGTLHAVRALEIDGTRAETHALLAQFHKQFDYSWPEIQRGLSRARAMNPASTLVRGLQVIGWLMPQGRIDEGIAELEDVLARDPLSMWANHWLGVMLVLARQWARVSAHSRAMIELDPASPWGHWLFAAGCRGLNLTDEAIAANRRAVELSGGWHFMLGWLGLMLGVAGRNREAQDVLGQLEGMARSQYVPPSSFAWVHLGLRDVDRAFEWLDRAVEARDQFMMPIKTYAFFDPVRNDPRFVALLRKMRLD